MHQMGSVNKMNLDYMKTINKMIENMEKVIIGKREVIEMILTTLLAEGHVLIEDVPGVGKTTLAKGLARTIDCGFTRIQFTPDTLPSDITGFTVYNMQKGLFEFAEGSIMNNIILADEINRTSPKTQASLLEAMQEQQVTVDGTTYFLKKPFIVMATQNPIDYMGTYNLPEAQMDRFMMKLSMGYPSYTDEIGMTKKYLSNDSMININPVVSGKVVEQLQQEVKQVFVHEDLLTYLMEIITKTRNSIKLSLGASPRATLMMIRASQAYAFVQGRDFVIPEDMIRLFPYVLPHRFLVSSEGRIGNINASQVLDDIISVTTIPVLPDKKL